MRNSEAGITMIETLMAGAILVVGSLGMLTLIVDAIATNNRNRIDSTQTMLATSILEQINSTLIGSGTSNLKDCTGTSWTINTALGGASLSGANIDFTQASPSHCRIRFNQHLSADRRSKTAETWGRK